MDMDKLELYKPTRIYVNVNKNAYSLTELSKA